MRTVLKTSTLLYCFVWLAAFALILSPLAALVIQSFTTTGSLSASLANFEIVFAQDAYLQAFVNTLLIGTISAALATAIGVSLAWTLVRTNVPAASLLEQLSSIPILIPPFVGAFSWLLLAAPRIGIINVAFRYLGLGEPLTVYSYLGIGWVMGIYLAPYVMMIVASALRNMDPSLEEAGRVVGLGNFRVLVRVTLPVVAPAVFSGAALSFVIAIGLFGTPAILGARQHISVITSAIYFETLKLPPNYGVMAALAVLLMFVAAGLALVQHLLLKGRSFVTVTGKGFRPTVIRLGQARFLLATAICLYLAFTVALPIVILITAAISTYVWSGTFTLQHIQDVLASSDVWLTLLTSINLTVMSTVLAVVLAGIVCWLCIRTNLPGRKLLEQLFLVPIAVPGIAFAVGVMAVALRMPFPLYGTTAIIIVAFIGRFCGYAVRNISSSLVQMHPELEESARVAGIRGSTIAIKIIIPLILPSIASSSVLLYSTFITELSIVALLHTAYTRTFSILSFETWSIGDFSSVATLSLIQLLLGLLVVSLAQMMLSGRARRIQ